MSNSRITAPVALTDAELDAVAGGLVNVGVVAVDVVDINNNDVLNNNDVVVAVPVNAAVAVLGVATAAQRPGRIR
ncbi:MAG TPA: hypothetical protein VE033_10205 [Acetobacteraceae bacterium]|jgi:hypothetical protein|nr:hypothetical protein [Acetobacteraceae bacterium]